MNPWCHCFFWEGSKAIKVLVQQRQKLEVLKYECGTFEAVLFFIFWGKHNGVYQQKGLKRGGSLLVWKSENQELQRKSSDRPGDVWIPKTLSISSFRWALRYIPAFW